MNFALGWDIKMECKNEISSANNEKCCYTVHSAGLALYCVTSVGIWLGQALPFEIT